ncbi:MAG: hypothetical protein HY721_07150 [Planctomycetes bacterium]|nr:hypothetical protein [Planctomycetota bacterium]
MTAFASITAFTAIARAAFTELVRLPAYGLIVLGTLVALALSPSLALFSMGEKSLLEDLGASTALLSGVLLAAFGVSAQIEKEIERRTLLVVFAKPVGRGAFLAAKLAGILLAVGLAVLLFTIEALLAVRIGPPVEAHALADGPALAGSLGALALGLAAGAALRRRGEPYQVGALRAGSLALAGGFGLAACFDARWRPALLWEIDLGLAGACALAFLGAALCGAVAVLIAVPLRRGALAGTLAVFAVSLALGGIESPWLGLVPDLRLFWVGDMFYGPASALPVRHVLEAGLYAACYGAGCLAAAAWALERRDVG